MDKYPDLEFVNEIVSWTSLIAVALLEAYSFIKLKFKMDTAALLIQINFLIILIQRKIVDFYLGQPPLYITLMAPLASITSYTLLYYFVFEMMLIVATIKSVTHVDRL